MQTKENQNNIAYEKFDDILYRGQLMGQDDDFDIRSYILGARHDVWNIGVVNKALETSYSSNMKSLFDSLVPVDNERFGKQNRYLIIGTVYEDASKSHLGAVQALQNVEYGDQCILFEQGFLASSHSWSECFQQQNPEYACLGYVYDDLAYYFMAEYPNRLNRRLNSNHSIPDPELERARNLIARIVEERISKYNSQPMRSPTMTEGYGRRVLVCDQTFADASTIYGKVDADDFDRMLVAAIQENPDAEIIVKTHPDTFWNEGKRTGYYTHLQSAGRVRILREPVNPFSLFEQVDKVYVGTSQIGLEALFAGKDVVCFGVPFYSGWGFTDDRQTIPNRERKRSLEELFYYFYIWYTIYNVPGKAVPSTIEDALSYIESHRPVKLTSRDGAAVSRPKVSVIIPVYGVENYIGDCIASVQSQSLDDIEIITVNDQSPDGSQAIIDTLAAEDDRIRPVVLQANVGQGFARNEGLKVARGEHIFFLDADDMLANRDVLREAFEAAVVEKADMVRVQKLVFRDGLPIESAELDPAEMHFPHATTLENAATNPLIMQSWNFWNYLYSKSFLDTNDIRFLTSQWEERAFITKAYVKAEKILALPVPGVLYRRRDDSTVRRKRTVLDLEKMIENIKFSAKSLQGTPSRAVGAMQFASVMFGGPWGEVLLEVLEGNIESKLLLDLSLAFREFDLEFSEAMRLSESTITRPLSDARLVLAATASACGEFGLLQSILRGEKVDQKLLLQGLLRGPRDKAALEFQRALSHYARNEMVAVSPAPAYAGPKPQIIVHIGSTKTGSTYIQHLLEANRPELLRRGIWYPEVGLFWQKDRPHKQAGHAAFTPAAVRKEPYLKDYIEAGLSLMDGRIHTIILSSEAYFLNEKSVMIADYFSQYPVKMIGYFRRQDDWANSQYCEFVGGGAVNKVDVPIEEWLSLPLTQERLSYRTQIDRWAERLGPENVIVRPYERKQFVDGEILADFWLSIGFPECASLERPSEEMRNDFPLDERHVRLMLQFNKLPYQDRDSYLQFVDAVTKDLARKYPKPARPDMLSVEIRGKLLADHAEENSYIARTYLNRVDGVLFEDASVRDRVGGPQTDIPLEDVELFYHHYRKYSPSTVAAAPKAGSSSQKPKVKKPAGARNRTAQPANAKVNFIPIRKSWSLMKKLRVTAKNVLLERPTRFERPLLGNAGKDEATKCTGPIKKNWSSVKRARVILKNIYFGRDIYFS